MNFDRMRALLLEQAVRGMLVSQRDDEPAVKQIGKVPDDVTFLIPEKWKWIAAQDAYELLSGRDLQKGEILDVESEAPSVPYITGASQIIDSRVLITRWTQNCSVKSVKGDLLLTCKGTVGKTAFNTVGDMHIARQIMALRAKPEIVEGKFLRLFIDSIAETLAKNAKSMIPGIDRKTLLKNSIPIPPLKEQRRIVAKLEESFAEIDRAEKAYRELQTFAGVLRGKILQEAVMGKLVPQLDDEPAVEQIGEVPEDVPFEIPEKWKWGVLSSIVPNVVDCPHSTPKYCDSETEYLAIDTNCIDDLGKITKWRYVTEEIYRARITRLTIQADDVIYTREGSIGRAARVPADVKVCMGQRVMLIRPGEWIDSSFLQIYLMSKGTLSLLTEKQRGIGVKHINVSDVKKLPVPIPPLEEQHRIVAKLEELMKQVDALSA